jgi:hypothetical protein
MKPIQARTLLDLMTNASHPRSPRASRDSVNGSGGGGGGFISNKAGVVSPLASRHGGVAPPNLTSARKPKKFFDLSTPAPLGTRTPDEKPTDRLSEVCLLTDSSVQHPTRLGVCQHPLSPTKHTPSTHTPPQPTNQPVNQPLTHTPSHPHTPPLRRNPPTYLPPAHRHPPTQPTLNPHTHHNPPHYYQTNSATPR